MRTRSAMTSPGSRSLAKQRHSDFAIGDRHRLGDEAVIADLDSAVRAERHTHDGAVVADAHLTARTETEEGRLVDATVRADRHTELTRAPVMEERVGAPQP